MISGLQFCQIISSSSQISTWNHPAKVKDLSVMLFLRIYSALYQKYIIQTLYSLVYLKRGFVNLKAKLYSAKEL